jgi:hypothetical protein
MKANVYICGIYQGQCEIGDDGLIGRLARLDLAGAATRLAEMTEELDAIPGVEASASITVEAPQAAQE